MKRLVYAVMLLLGVSVMASCGGKGQGEKNDNAAANTETDSGQQQNVMQSKLKGYEWLEGVWAAAEGPETFGRMIVTDTYFQVVNSNMDDAFDDVEKMPKKDYNLEMRHEEYDGYDDDGEVFGFDDYVGVDVNNHCIYINQGEYMALTLQKINEEDFETAVFVANHCYPRRVYSNAYDAFVNIRESTQPKSPVVGAFKNGPDGAVLLEAGKEWTKIDYDGIVGYVHSKYIQDAPTVAYTGSATIDDIAGVYSGEYTMYLWDDGTWERGYDFPFLFGKFIFQNNEVKLIPTQRIDPSTSKIEKYDDARSEAESEILPIDLAHHKIGDWEKQPFLTKQDIEKIKEDYPEEEWGYAISQSGISKEDFKKKKSSY